MLRLASILTVVVVLGCSESSDVSASRMQTASDVAVAPTQPVPPVSMAGPAPARPAVTLPPVSPAPADAGAASSPYVGVFRGVSRTLTTTALGHPAAVACHNCYNLLGNEPLPLPKARARVAKAVAEGADFIEIDVVEIKGRLYACHSDLAEPGTLPLLTDLLSTYSFRNSDALLVLEIKEGDTDPALFAQNLLSAVAASGTHARPGRPVFIKAFNIKLDYLLAAKQAGSALPALAPYLRYYLLHSGLESLPEFQEMIDTQVVANGLDGIDLFYRTPHLAAVTGYARALGLGVAVWTVPGPKLGELAVLALREQVDVITTDLPLDRARALVEAQDVRSYLDTRDLDAATNLTMFRATPAAASRELVALDASAPAFERGAVGDAMYGGALRFTRDRALTLPAPGPSSQPGFVVNALVRFDTLELAANQTMPIMEQLEEGAFRFELHRDASGSTELRFGVNVGGVFGFQARSVAGDGNATCSELSNVPFVGALDRDHAYLLTGVYTPDGRVLLFINLQCAGAAQPTQGGSIKASQSGVRLGRSLASTDERLVAFDGSVQRLELLDWAGIN